MQQLQAVVTLEPQIHDEQIRLVAFEQSAALREIRGGDRVESRRLQKFLQAHTRRKVVFDDENLWWHEAYPVKIIAQPQLLKHAQIEGEAGQMLANGWALDP